MIILRSKLQIADNSGGRIAMCIGMTKYPKVASIGRVINVSIKEIYHGSSSTSGKLAGAAGSLAAPIRPGQVFKALVVRTKKETRRPDGRFIRFDDNAVVLLAPDAKTPVASRVLGPIPSELRKDWLKVVTLANNIV